MVMTLSQHWPVYFKDIEVWCGQCLQYLTKVNCYNSINQSNIYSANITGEARLSGATAKSVFNSKIEETVPQIELK